MVTKSGSNTFHGSLYEFHRNTATAANSWFNNLSNTKKPALLRNWFGGTIGGPVVKDKLFFFFNFQGRRDARSVSTGLVVPLDSFRNGTVSYIKATDSTGAACPTAGAVITRQNTRPDCVGSLNAAQIAALDPQHVGTNSALLQFINGRYPHANDLTAGDGINTGMYRFSTPLSRVGNDYVTRVDYNLNNNMKVFGRFTIVRDRYGDSVNYTAPVKFPGDQLTKTIENTSYSYVAGHTWTLSPTIINQFNYGVTVSQLGFPTGWNPAGTTTWAIGGSWITSPYFDQSSQARKNPIPIFRDDLTWQKGNHNIQLGGFFKPIKTTSTLVGDYNIATLGVGGLNGTLGPSSGAAAFAVRPADIKIGSSTARTTYDNAFAFMLGRYASIASDYNYNNSLTPLTQGTGATRQYRYWETEAYIQDTWKATTDLSLTFGVRYQYYSVPYEVNGIQSVQNLGFDELLTTRINAGYAGASGDSVIPITYYDLGGKANNARGLYEPNLTNFAPRFSFAYSPKAKGWLEHILGDKNTVFRGGAGVVYDHPVTNALNFIQDQNSYMFQSSTSRVFGGVTATDALLNDPRFTGSTIPTPVPAPSVARPFAPFVVAGSPEGTADNEFNYAIDPKLRTPYSIVFNFGIQRELPHHFVAEATYVGRLGRRLIAQADASQLVDFKDPASGQLMSAAFANLTNEIRAGGAITSQPWFENQVIGGTNAVMSAADLEIGDVADAVQALIGKGALKSNIGLPAQFAGNTYITNKGSSNYHGLLASLHKNMSNGLQFDLNYTFSHSIDNASGIANSIASGDGMGFICDARNLRVCRGNSDFDVKQIINGNFIYELPFGKGKAFGNSSNGTLDRVIGGWSLSGIPTWRSGFAWSDVTGAYLMGYANNSPAILTGNRSALAVDVHRASDGTVYLFKDPDNAAKAFTSPSGFTVGNRNILRGPGYFNLDLGVAKVIPVSERFKLQFRADASILLTTPASACRVAEKPEPVRISTTQHSARSQRPPARHARCSSRYAWSSKRW